VACGHVGGGAWQPGVAAATPACRLLAAIGRVTSRAPCCSRCALSCRPGLKPADVDYVNAHATSTPAGDMAGASVSAHVHMLPLRVCGPAACGQQPAPAACRAHPPSVRTVTTRVRTRARACAAFPPFPAEYRAIRGVMPQDSLRMNSTKSMIGHLLGGAGAVEAVATIKAIETGVVWRPKGVLGGAGWPAPRCCCRVPQTPVRCCSLRCACRFG
jgi:hypothetical protein